MTGFEPVSGGCFLEIEGENAEARSEVSESLNSTMDMRGVQPDVRQGLKQTPHHNARYTYSVHLRSEHRLLAAGKAFSPGNVRTSI